MTEAAVFQGTYSDLCFRKTRSVAVISVEIPIEMAGAFVAAFGAPVPGAEIPVALARLDPKKAVSEAPKGAQVTDKTEAHDAKPRRKFSDMPLSAQAGMRCAEPAFSKFLIQVKAANFDPLACDDENAADFVREYCIVDSRSQIRAENEAGNAWRRLNHDYELWLLAAEPT